MMATAKDDRNKDRNDTQPPKESIRKSEVMSGIEYYH